MTKKRILLLIALPVIFFAGIAIYVTAPWTLMYLYGTFVLPEPEQPHIAKESFPFTLVYEQNGEEIVLKDTMICSYTGSDWYMIEDKKSRTWGMELASGKDEIVLWEGKNKHEKKQRLIYDVEPAYLMGDVEEEEEYQQAEEEEYRQAEEDDFLYPGMTKAWYLNSCLLLKTFNANGECIEEEIVRRKKLLSKYGIKIVRFECREPVKNTFG